MELEDLFKILHGDISHIERVNTNDIALYDMEVTITPKDVRRMLDSYLLGNITAGDLINWAGFICIRAEYTAPENNDEDYYDKMWDVIHWISTPEIDGEINKSTAKEYLDIINEYPD